jgi:hypothetical protein
MTALADHFILAEAKLKFQNASNARFSGTTRKNANGPRLPCREHRPGKE